jgi:UDP-sugar transporter A1/2/3
MVFMLRRQLSLVQWFALFLLFIGISLVQVENMTSTTPKQDVNAVYGFLAVIIACKFQINNQIISSYFYFLGTFSGLAGVYFEKILKGSDVSVWIRNIQLGVFGIFFGIITMILSDGTEVKALVVKHADNILKGFATSSAIVLSCIVSMLLFDFQLTLLFTVGAGLVIFSIFLYSKPDLILSVPIINIFFKDRSVLF